jgi:hypothetical protein
MTTAVLGLGPVARFWHTAAEEARPGARPRYMSPVRATSHQPPTSLTSCRVHSLKPSHTLTTSCPNTNTTACSTASQLAGGRSHCSHASRSVVTSLSAAGCQLRRRGLVHAPAMACIQDLHQHATPYPPSATVLLCKCHDWCWSTPGANAVPSLAACQHPRSSLGLYTQQPPSYHVWCTACLGACTQEPAETKATPCRSPSSALHCTGLKLPPANSW